MSKKPRAIPREVVQGTRLRDQSIDPETVDFKVSHATHFATVDGELRQIQTTVLELPDGQRFEWFPEGPDHPRRRPADS